MVIRLVVNPSCETCRPRRSRSCQSPVQRTCYGRGRFQDGCAKWSSNSPCRRRPHFEHSSAQQSLASCASKTLSGRHSQIAPALVTHSRSLWPLSKTDAQIAGDSALSVQTFPANLSASNSWRLTADDQSISKTSRIVFCCCYCRNVNNKNGGQPACLLTTCSRKISRDYRQTTPITGVGIASSNL